QSTISKLESYIQDLPEDKSYMIAENEVSFGPAVTAPNKIICVGLNYQKHADETGSPYPKTPILFTKYNNTLAGHNQNIVVPKVTEKLDYEVELGIVIGKETKDVAKETALDHVFGYVTANDLSARDLQFVSSQWLLGKSCDGFSPVGPYLVTSNEIDDPNNLTLKTFVNGEERQSSNTSDMIFHCDEIISYISKYMTLTPGDIILTGTPEGVVMGLPEEKQVYIQPGDEVTVEIEKLGSLTNQFVEDK
ncbi:fumarylacetoacetate hydrolase family protein, partial [Virgibacillus sp. W0181]|uniref:fumarylacetoacetate hydrolase family protein n=1 Tax=Virgibacillus sp. W0181 TaxID=3391581 RepID=UPI003F47267C